MIYSFYANKHNKFHFSKIIVTVLLLISKLFNFLLRYWTKFEIRFRGFVEKFWKVDKFSRNPERVSGQFKRKPCPIQAHVYSSRIQERFDSTLCSRHIAVENFNENGARRQWIFDAWSRTKCGVKLIRLSFQHF